MVSVAKMTGLVVVFNVMKPVNWLWSMWLNDSFGCCGECDENYGFSCLVSLVKMTKFVLVCNAIK